MPEPVGSQNVNVAYYDEAHGMCVDLSPAARSTAAAPTGAPLVASGLDEDPASAQLVKNHDRCAPQKIALAQSVVSVVGSAAAVAAASPTTLGVLPSLAAFVASSVAVGKAAAELESCQRLESQAKVGSGI